MIKIKRIHKIHFSVILLTVLSFQTIGQASNNSTSDVIDSFQIIQDVNGIGVVLDNDISSFIDANSFLYIFIALNQNYELNGIYIAGFDWNDGTMLLYKLGNPYDTKTIWFESSFMLNYGSVIYFDILDYLIAQGEPDVIKGLVLLSAYSFSDMELNVNFVLSDYESSFISVAPTNPSTTTTSNPNSVSTSTNPTSASNSGVTDTTSYASTKTDTSGTNSNTVESSSTLETTSNTSVSNSEITDRTTKSPIKQPTTTTGFEVPFIGLLMLVAVKLRKNSH